MRSRFPGTCNISEMGQDRTKDSIGRQSVSVANLLVLPVWGTISTSGLYLMLFSKSDNVDTGGSGSGVP